MVTIFNKVTFEWNATDSPQLLSADWVVDPTFVDKDRCERLGPRLWIFEGSVIRPMSDEEINTNLAFVAEAISAKIVELSEACHLAIVGGFLSSALGTPHIYDSKEEDQLNLLGSVTATAPNPETQTPAKSQYFGVRDPDTRLKAYKMHTYIQLRRVLDEGTLWKLAQLQKFNAKRVLLGSCSTVAAVTAITWDSTP